MKIFHKDADYAVRLLVYLATQDDEYRSSAELAEALGIPLNYLRRIGTKLIGGGFLSAREGKHGGVRLSLPPKAIHLLELMELFHGRPELSECTLRKKICPNRKKCVLRRRIQHIEEIVAKEFRAITIQSLVDDMSRGKTCLARDG